jgi:alpha-amylase/alpha-mannosidase (GH57 family)
VDATNNFERFGSDLLKDPWQARNDFIKLILDEGQASEAFITGLARRSLSHHERQLALKLLEIQRNALLMFTSCGWFFSDLGGIETIQVLRYAARVIELQKELGIETPRGRFLEMLAEAQSNVLAKGNGADIFLRYVEGDGIFIARS